MSANDYWAKAQSGSPGTNLAEMQARLYAGETQRMMEKFTLFWGSGRCRQLATSQGS